MPTRTKSHEVKPIEPHLRNYMAGDDEAFATLWDAIRPLVWYIARENSKGRLAAGDPLDDTVSEIMVKLLANMRRLYNPAMPFRQWLGTVVRNYCWNQNLLAENARTGFLHEPEGDDGDSAARLVVALPDRSARGRVFDVACDRELRGQRDAILSRMPRHLAEVLGPMLCDGLTANEVAEATGVSISAVKSRVREAKRRFAREYCRLRGGPPSGMTDGGHGPQSTQMNPGRRSVRRPSRLWGASPTRRSVRSRPR